jgi:hypothetical protein
MPEAELPPGAEFPLAAEFPPGAEFPLEAEFRPEAVLARGKAPGALFPHEVNAGVKQAKTITIVITEAPRNRRLRALGVNALRVGEQAWFARSPL